MIRRRTIAAPPASDPVPAGLAAAKARRGQDRAAGEFLEELAAAAGIGPAPPAAASPKRHPSYERIYAVVRRIPAGRVATYGQVAALAGLAGHARQVGYALNKTPAGRRLPWYRVLNAKGQVSLSGSAGEEQWRCLRAEGVVLDGKGRVSLRRYQWQPRERTR